jgi:peroxiredoxin
MVAEHTKQQPPGRSARQTRLIQWISAAAAVVVAGLIVWGLLASSPAATNPAAGGTALPDFYGRAGQAAANFTLKDVANQPVSLHDFRGKRVLVNFWYIACPGCQAEMDALEQYYAQAQGQGVVVLGLDIVDDASATSRYLQQRGITYPVALDTQQRALESYGVTSTPSSFFIDTKGIIRGSVSGPLNLKQVQTYVAALH